MAQTLHDIGEQGAWRVMQPFLLPSRKGLLSFGDDTAVTEVPAGQRLLWTSDMLVEGVHFLPEFISWSDLGHKAMAVNLSDMAAMGGEPLHALVSIGLPDSFEVANLRALYRGMATELNKFGAGIIGGDTVRSPQVVINVSLSGLTPQNRALPLRSRCRAGQNLYVTGAVGDSGAGLALLLNAKWKQHRESAWGRALIARHHRPQPRVQAGAALSAALKDLAMIDVSDGVAHECELLSASSQAVIELEAEALPISRALRQFAEATREDEVSYALGGGEDYELLFATKTSQDEIRQILTEKGICLPVSRIGRVAAKGKGKSEVRILSSREHARVQFEHFG